MWKTNQVIVLTSQKLLLKSSYFPSIIDKINRITHENKRVNNFQCNYLIKIE